MRTVTEVMTPKAPSAQDELAQVGTGRRARGAAGVEGALGGGEGEAEDHLVEASVAGRGLSAGAGRGEAADGGPLVGLGEVAEGVAAFGEQRLGLGGAQAGLQGGGAGDLVEVEQAVHVPQVEGDEVGGSGPALGGEAADDGRAAAEGDEGQAVPGAGVEYGQHLVMAVREDDGGRGVGGVAGPHPQQVGGGLAAGVADPGLGVGAHPFRTVADGGLQRAAGGGVQR
jgi:hypothetical protein